MLQLTRKIHGGHELSTPDWLQRPGRAEAGRCWRALERVYYELTAMNLPDSMPLRERRTVDCVLQRRGEPPRNRGVRRDAALQPLPRADDPLLPAHHGGGL